ncbi:MAG: phosphoglucosamine mutase, partial [Synechococcus sp. Tobar2m-G35]|nr:phosphoglucosamine mutase [Synechococcus sp. Tobar2m-G35]
QWQASSPLQQAIAAAEAAMGADGRVLVRASGTEPLLRVMVEASSQDCVDHWTESLCAVADRCLNG